MAEGIEGGDQDMYSSMTELANEFTIYCFGQTVGKNRGEYMPLTFYLFSYLFWVCSLFICLFAEAAVSQQLYICLPTLRFDFEL